MIQVNAAGGVWFTKDVGCDPRFYQIPRAARDDKGTREGTREVPKTHFLFPNHPRFVILSDSEGSPHDLHRTSSFACRRVFLLALLLTNPIDDELTEP